MLGLIHFLMTLALQGGGTEEPTDRIVPPGWQGNPWGPTAHAAREAGELPAIEMTPELEKWADWGRDNLQDGDILFRQGDARLLWGYYPFSRLLANITGSIFSHVGTAVIEDGELVVYDTTKAGVRRQPFHVWTMDNVGDFAVKRLKPEYQQYVPGVVEYLHRVYEEQVPFDYNLRIGDEELYCVEMTEKAFRSQNLELSRPVPIMELERFDEFPLNVYWLLTLSKWLLDEPLDLDQAIYLPGNESHGIWASPLLETVTPPPGPDFEASRMRLVDDEGEAETQDTKRAQIPSSESEKPGT
ncbi:hypothetical protein BH23PLA1_BH23PLA1_30730 [soil metagenome]